jgi:pimeloyl-ACP methyl ester carboxylesterase/quercetin dioxygenase-like cupin family protein
MRAIPHAVLIVALVLSGERGFSHDEIIEREVSFDCSVASIGGTITLPGHDRGFQQSKDDKQPHCVVIVGGTLSHTRDGAMIRDGAPPRDALKRLAHILARNGYASLRYDKVGYGQSQATDSWTGTYLDESVVAAAAIKYARDRKDLGQVVVAGESAGAYLACLAAKSGAEADAYIFLGGHCGTGAAIYEFNFGRLVRLAENDVAWKTWAEKNLRFELALGRRNREMFEAAQAGSAEFEIVDGDFRRNIGLARRKEELDMPPDEMFRYIKKPALALSGEFDLNVPPDHAARIVQVLRTAGNHASTCVLIRGADHSFQMAPADEQSRLRERYNFESFRRNYSPQLYEEVVAWLDTTLQRTATSAKLPDDVKPARLPVRAVEKPERDARTENAPARLQLAPGIQIVEDVTDKAQTVGVQTLEGEIGPLLLGEDCQAHFIDMPAGMYCEEHPHSSESIIYTVRGKWVLCSKNRRHVMQPGTLFHFAPNTPTGYEVPFTENALILIFKGKRLTEKEEDFIAYLKTLAARLEREHEAGVPYLLTDLPTDHPALQFAKEVNPKFGKDLKPE